MFGLGACWGYNDQGQLGDGGSSDSSVPVSVSGGYNFSSISISDDHTCAVLVNGSGVCWGTGLIGGGASWSYVPIPVSGDYSFISNSFYWSRNTVISRLPDYYYNSGETWTFTCNALNAEYVSNQEYDEYTIP